MRSQPRQSRSRRAAFSLTEVTMATGIIAAVALPLLAMLADATSSQGSARDRGIAAHIARDVNETLFPVPTGDFEMRVGDLPAISIPLPRAGETVRYLAFGADARLLGEVDADSWNRGARSDAAAFHLVRLRLSAVAGGTADLGGLLDLELTVSQPAAAALSSRSQDVFRSRLASPPASP